MVGNVIVVVIVGASLFLLEIEFVHFLLCVVHLLLGVLESFHEDVECIVVPSTGEVMAQVLRTGP